MKQTIRRGVFETNSSSTHTLVINSKYNDGWDAATNAIMKADKDLLGYITEHGLNIGRPKDWKYPNSKVELFEKKVASIYTCSLEWDCGNPPMSYEVILVLQKIANILGTHLVFSEMDILNDGDNSWDITYFINNNTIDPPALCWILFDEATELDEFYDWDIDKDFEVPEGYTVLYQFEG